MHALVNSKEVVRRAQADVRDFSLARSRVELEEIILHEFINLHYGGLISTSVAVVGRWEDSDHVALMSPIVTIHNELMGSGDASQVIGVVELLGDILSEAVTRTSGGDTPTTTIIGIRPQ